MKYINKADLAKRWNCHITNINYHAKVGHIKTRKINGRMMASIESVEAFELEYNKRVRLPIPKKLSFWDKVKLIFNGGK